MSQPSTPKRRAAARKSFHKRRAEGKQIHPNALKVRPYDQRTKARRYLQVAVRLGWIDGLKPGERPVCEGCGACENVDGHHRDYEKMYEVDWLCRICHAAEHRGELVRNGPPAPRIILTKPCEFCGKDTPRGEMRGLKVFCNECEKTVRKCGICKEVKALNSFSGEEHRCKPCNAKRVALHS